MKEEIKKCGNCDEFDADTETCLAYEETQCPDDEACSGWRMMESKLKVCPANIGGIRIDHSIRKVMRNCPNRRSLAQEDEGDGAVQFAIQNLRVIVEEDKDVLVKDVLGLWSVIHKLESKPTVQDEGEKLPVMTEGGRQ